MYLCNILLLFCALARPYICDGLSPRMPVGIASTDVPPRDEQIRHAQVNSWE